MTNQRALRIRQIYGIVLSVSIVVTAVCLIMACVGIYRSGDQPFSREAVAAAFSPIAFPVYLCLILVAGGFLLNLLLGEPAQKPPVQKQHALILKRLRETRDIAAADDEIKASLSRLRSERRRMYLICTGICLVCAVIFLIYALNSTHFHSSEITGSMISAMYVLLPCLAVSLAACLLTVYHSRAGVEQEIQLLKQCPKKAAAAPAGGNRALCICRCVILILAAALLTYGFLTGGTADVLTKAINICTECVGLG